MPESLHHRFDGVEGAPVLVFSNSLGTTLEMWDDQVAALASRFRILRYDTRGHGRSPAPDGPYAIDDLGADVLALLDELGLERVSFCGLSLGGMTGMWLAAHAPERVERLVLCCTSAHLPPRELWEERIATVRAEGMDAVAEGVLERWLTPAFRSARPEVAARLKAMLAATPVDGYAGCCAAIRDLDVRDVLGTIRAPTLVIAGGEDPATPPAHAELIRDAIDAAQLVVLSPAAHLANIEQAAAVDRALLDHLAGDAWARGVSVRREVLGDAHVDAALAGEQTQFQDLITRYAWGEIWTRPGLDRRMRSAITLTALVALGRLDELALHLRAARRNGLSDAEIEEVLLQSAIYCGVPAANSAFAVARRVLAEP